MRQGLVFSIIVLIIFCTPVWGIGGDMGVGTEPLTDGSAEHPYLIEDLADFDKFSGDSSYWAEGVHAKLVTDINLSGRAYTQAVIVPNSDVPFSGVFDGRRHIISNLTITATDGSDNLGLFGMISTNGSIVNLGLDNANVSGTGDAIGSLCGRNYYASITNCYASGTVDGNNNIGGLCGYNYRGDIVDCYATVSVSGTGDGIGGLCGKNLSSNITNCFATGTVEGDESVGGLAGINWTSDILNCYATGVVSGIGTDIGGLCGYNYLNSITNCYATGAVRGNYDVGGLCGENKYGTLKNCYAIGVVNGIFNGNDRVGGLCGGEYGATINCYFYCFGGLNNGRGTALDDFQLLDRASYVDFDFSATSEDGNDDDWTMVEGHCPKLSWQPDDGPLAPFILDTITTTLNGAGYADNPFVISSYEDLMEFRGNSTLRIGYYILTDDIDLAGQTYDVAFISEFFNGYFDGCGHVISNLRIDGGGVLGFFSTLYGEVTNLGLLDVNISGTATVGSLCSFNDSGGIKNCFATGTVSGSSTVGGLCGYNLSGNLMSCYANVMVSGLNVVGGLCGSNDDGSNITNCFATGTVSGSSAVGGLCGRNSSGNLMNCYARGLVSGKGFSVGGLCGTSLPGSIMSCYFLESAGPDSRYGISLSDNQMKQQASYLNWDFENIWWVDEGNDCPRLWWEPQNTAPVANVGSDKTAYAWVDGFA